MSEGSIPGRAYPPTRLTLIEAIAGSDEQARARAAETIAAAYWRPVYATLRLRHRMEPADAEDATQGFLGEAFARDWFHRYDPARGRFRTFLRTCLDRYVGHLRESAGRIRRGGGAAMVPLDAPDVESHLAAEGGEDAAFDREWARGIVGLALIRLETECAASDRRVRYEVFRRYDVDPDEADRPTYAALGTALGIPATQVTNHLHWARREFRRLVLEALREVTGGEAEFREEARLLLGEEVA